MALLEYLMTPIRLQGTQSSPLQLMKKRTIRGILPVRQQGTCSSDYERKLSRRQEQAKYQSAPIVYFETPSLIRGPLYTTLSGH